MYWLVEFYAGDRSVIPAHNCVERLKAVKLDPEALTDARVLYRFHAATCWRNIENIDTEIIGAVSPQSCFCADCRTWAFPPTRG